MKLLIISHTPHYKMNDGTLAGWGPTVREINYLADHFSTVTHLAPLHPGQPPASSLPYTASNIRLRTVPPAGGDSLGQKLKILPCIGSYVKIIREELAKADIVHIRCPANISLIALLVLAGCRRPRYRWVKYAGNWHPDGKEPWSYTFQRRWLHKGLHRGIVTINGSWPGQPSWVHSFLNPCLTLAEVHEAKEMVADKKISYPLQLLFVGRVEAAKGAGRILEVASALKSQGLDFELHIVGDGPEMPAFVSWVKDHDLTSTVVFHGWLPRPELPQLYSKAHFFLLPSSASEGWPKVLSEAMAYGAVPLAGAVSSIPQIIADIGCGLALPPFLIEGFVTSIKEYINQPEKWRQESQAGRAAAKNFCYDSYVEHLTKIFRNSWNLKLPTGSSDLSNNHR